MAHKLDTLLFLPSRACPVPKATEPQMSVGRLTFRPMAAGDIRKSLKISRNLEASNEMQIQKSYI